MLRLMAEPTFDKGVNVRTTGACQKALRRVVNRLKESPEVVWKGGEVSQEAVVNACWLWLDGLRESDPAALEAIFAAAVPRLEALLSSRPAAPDPPVSGPLDLDPRTDRPAPAPGRRRKNTAG
jgi:hypothetical protein